MVEAHRREIDLPAASTIGDILKRNALVAPRRKRNGVVPYTQPFSGCERPNDLWCVDFKGHFPVGDGVRCYPLTVTEGYSRLLLECRAMLETDGISVQRVFEGAFRFYGLSPGDT
jgi:transposase InsO family protein